MHAAAASAVYDVAWGAAHLCSTDGVGHVSIALVRSRFRAAAAARDKVAAYVKLLDKRKALLGKVTWTPPADYQPPRFRVAGEGAPMFPKDVVDELSKVRDTIELEGGEFFSFCLGQGWEQKLED